MQKAFLSLMFHTSVHSAKCVTQRFRLGQSSAFLSQMLKLDKFNGVSVTEKVYLTRLFINYALDFICYNMPIRKRCTTLRRKCYSSKAVPCLYPNPNPDEMLSKSIFRGLSFYGINLKLMRRELKMIQLFSTEYLSTKCRALSENGP